MGILERIKEIEAEMARTQKNKATEHHLGGLKAKLARLRSQLLDPPKGSGGGKGDGFDVARQGDARVCMIGFPSVGKSTLLNSLTATSSQPSAMTVGASGTSAGTDSVKQLSAVGAYEFTTLCCQPSVFYVNNAKIQLLDLPGIIEGAAEGRGRGRQVIAVAHSCDLILVVLDATKDDRQQQLLVRELEAVGIRLNKRPPNISLRVKKGGGLTVNFTVPCPRLNLKTVQQILQEYKIFNADVVIREDCSADDFIDVVEGNRKYVRCIYVYNKVDMLPLDEIDKIARRPYSVVISSSALWNLEQLKERIWEELGISRVYTKKKGQFPDFEDPVVMTEQR
ncbi:putative GTP-binding protein, partial [Toxoplasma gondii GAB2-2007-GAL-DOM2]